jgi:PAS domain-containing protein
VPTSRSERAATSKTCWLRCKTLCSVVDGEGHLRYLNNAALQLFGVRVEDVLGAALLEALPSFGLESAVRSALQEGISTSREVGLYWSPPSTQSDGANSTNLPGKA